MPVLASLILLNRYRAKIANSKRLGRTDSTPPRHSRNSSAAAATIRAALKLKCSLLTTEGMQTMEIPKIRPILAVTEPTALPTARSTSPASTPVMETVSSGSVVASETMVAPMINRGTPVTSAIHTAPSRNQSPPLTISTSPSINRRITVQRFIRITVLSI